MSNHQYAHKKTKPGKSDFVLRYLRRLDGIGGAATFARAAIDAFVGNDDILVIARFDARNGTFGFANAAVDAIVVDDIGHGEPSSYVVVMSLYHRITALARVHIIEEYGMIAIAPYIIMPRAK